MRMRLAFFLIIPLTATLLVACKSEPAHVSVGKGYLESPHMVFDTTSSLLLNDPFYMQLFLERDFEVPEVEVTLYKGTTAEHKETVFTQKMDVNPKAVFLVIRGPSNNPLTARGFMRTNQPGPYYFEFRVAGQVVAGKEVALHNSKE